MSDPSQHPRSSGARTVARNARGQKGVGIYYMFEFIMSGLPDVHDGETPSRMLTLRDQKVEKQHVECIGGSQILEE